MVVEMSPSTVLPADGRPVDISDIVWTHSEHGERKALFISACVKRGTHQNDGLASGGSSSSGRVAGPFFLPSPCRDKEEAGSHEYNGISASSEWNKTTLVAISKCEARLRIGFCRFDFCAEAEFELYFPGISRPPSTVFVTDSSVAHCKRWSQSTNSTTH